MRFVLPPPKAASCRGESSGLTVLVLVYTCKSSSHFFNIVYVDAPSAKGGILQGGNHPDWQF